MSTPRISFKVVRFGYPIGGPITAKSCAALSDLAPFVRSHSPGTIIAVEVLNEDGTQWTPRRIERPRRSWRARFASWLEANRV